MKKILGALVFLALARSVFAAPETRTVVVLPFENQSNNSDLGWISEAFAEVISWRLERPELYVLGREERSAAYDQLGIPFGTPLTLATSYKLAQTLGVDWAVVGSFKVDGNQLTARCQLLEPGALKLTPAIEVTGALADLVDLQTQLAWRMLATHDPDFTASTEEAFARAFPPLRLDAFESYIRGVLATDQESRVHFLVAADHLDSASRRPAFELGRDYFDRKEYGESAQWLSKLTPRDPHYPESLFFLGVDEYFLGKDAEAEKTFAALAHDVPLSEVHNNLGVMQARQGSYEQAVKNLTAAYQGDPSDPDFAFNLAACFWHLKNYREAADYLARALRESENDPEAHTLLALVDSKLGSNDGEHRERKWLAAHQGDSAAAIAPDFSPQLRIKKKYDGRAFRLLSLVVQNTIEAKLAAEPPAEHAQAHVELGKKLLAEGRAPEAERELSEAVALEPSSSEAHLVLGQILEAEGKHQDAVRELETSLKLDNNAMTQLWLARVYLSLNESDQALKHGQAALALDPGNRDVQRLLQAIRERPAVQKKQ